MIRTIVVDDEPAALGRYSAYVEDFGEPYVVAARCSGAREAFEAATLRGPDLVITDIRMPGEDGLALLQRLRDAGWPGAAVIISGHDDFGYAQRAIRIGILDYLLKPVFPEDMRALLERIAGRIAEGARPILSLAEAGRGLPEQVLKAIRFIDARYDSHFTIEEAARAACVSPAWLSSSFKRCTGLSIMEYARQARIEKARELLAGTEVPLKEVADRLAFPDLPTFAKLFRKIAGTSPGAYRKAMRGRGPGRGGEEGA